MGPCQGGFCTYRAIALWDEVKRDGAPAHNGAAASADNSHGANITLLRHFLQERWKGVTPIMWGDQLRQLRLDQLIYLDTMGLDLLPEPLTHKPENDREVVTEHPAIATEYHAS
jgi:glycerol-3-phosphate dehydrogenase